jgi:tetratricopeptide (TPR) repeat protein
MAPEQLEGRGSDPRGDQFALCVALCESLGGRRPFASESVEELLLSIRRGPELPRGIPRYLRRVLARGLALTPSARFPDMSALARAIEPQRRRGLAIAAIAAVAALAAGTVWMLSSTREDECSVQGRDDIRSWTAERASIAAAFQSSGVEALAASWQLIEPRVDTFSSGLKRSRIEVCHRSGKVPAPVYARRDECLMRARIGLESILKRWASGDRDGLFAAPTAVARLPSPDECATISTAGDSLEVIDERVQRAASRINAGEVAVAEAELARLVAELAESDKRRSYAAALLELSRAQLELGKIAKASSSVTRAAAAADRAGADDLRARAWISAASMAGDEGGDLEGAAHALVVAEGAVERLGQPEALRAEIETARGRAELRRGDADAAIAAFRAALALPSPSPMDEALRHQLLARAYSIAGTHEPMLQELERARDLIESAAGPEHPSMAPVLNSMIEPLEYLGRRPEAFERGEEALVLMEKSYGPEHPDLAGPLNNLGILYSRDNKLDRAIELSKRAIAIRVASVGSDHPDVAADRINLAATLADAKRFEEAKVSYELAGTSLRASLGPDHPYVAFVEAGLGRVLFESGKKAEGITHQREALRIRQSISGDPFQVTATAFTLAEMLEEEGDGDEALRIIRASLRGLPEAETERQKTLLADIAAKWGAAVKP